MSLVHIGVLERTFVTCDAEREHVQHAIELWRTHQQGHAPVILSVVDIRDSRWEIPVQHVTSVCTEPA